MKPGEKLVGNYKVYSALYISNGIFYVYVLS